MANRKLIYGQSGSITYEDSVLAVGWYPSPYDTLPIRAALLSQAYVTDDPIHDLEIVNKKYADALALGSLGIKAANLICAGPVSGDPAFATFRSLVNADFPDTLSLNVLSIGTLSIDSLSISGLIASRYVRTDASKNLVSDSPDKWVDAQDYDTLELANTAAYAAGKLLVISQNYTLTANTVLTTNIKVLPGGRFTKASTYTLAINGSFEAGLYQVFSGFAAGDVTGLKEIRPEWVGAKADDLDASATVNTTAINLAAGIAANGVVAYGQKTNLLLSAGTYKVTATSGNYALTIKCPIKGEGPDISIIKNIGTGSALKIEGVIGEIYYSRWSGFSVVGTAASEDGIVLNVTGDLYKAVGYSNFDNVYSQRHGRHGLVHNGSWATKYTSCKFTFNGGLGVYLVGTGSYSQHNNVVFQNCDSRWNGGTGDATVDFTKGGVRISGLASGVYWLGGVVESNNAWGFIIGDATYTIYKVVIRNIYGEQHPRSTATSATGGFLYLFEKYMDVSVADSTIYYEAPTGKTSVAFYLNAAAEASPGFREWNNYVVGAGPGTSIRDVNLSYADKWGSVVEIISDIADREFSGTPHWQNGDFDTFTTAGTLTIAATGVLQYGLLNVLYINNGIGFVYGKRYGIKYDATANGSLYFASYTRLTKLPFIFTGTGQAQEFTWLETNANQNLYIYSAGASSAIIDNISIYEIGGGVAPQTKLNGLLSMHNVSLGVNGYTLIYTVPLGKRCVLSHAILVAGAAAGGSTISIGSVAVATDFLPVNTLSNLAAEFDSVILMPIPNTTPLLIKSYAAGTEIRATVASHAGGGVNLLYLFGIVY